MRVASKISKYLRQSIVRKLIAFNSAIILLVFITAFMAIASSDSRLSLQKEQDIMNTYLTSTLDQVNNYYKDMSRVSMVAFTDSITQEIMKESASYGLEQVLEREEYLHNLFLSLAFIRDDICGIFIFDNNNLLYSYDDSFSLWSDFRVDNYPRYFRQSEESLDLANNCYVLTGPLPEFLRKADFRRTTFQNNYLIMMREVYSFQPHERIGFIMLLSPVSAIYELLVSVAEPGVAFLLTDSHGTIICDSSGTRISQLLAEYDETLFDRIPMRGESVSFSHTLEDVHSFISAKTSEYNGFTLFTVRPTADIYRDTRNILGFIVVVALLALLVSVTSMSYVVRRTIKPIVSLSKTMALVSKGNTRISETVVTEDETSWLTRSFNEMMDTINDLILSEYEATIRLQRVELAQKETQLLYLLGQINPHFLYNTLDTIRIKAAINNDMETAQMIMHLVDFFRHSFRTDPGLVTVEHEIDLIKSYLKLMKYRYPSLRDTYKCDPSLMDALIPSFVLQPLVENSLTHGLKSVHYRGKITVQVKRDSARPEDMCIILSDNGVGMDDGMLGNLQATLDNCKPFGFQTGADSHIGVMNVQMRLRMLYPDKYGLTYKSIASGGVSVIIRLPVAPPSPITTSSESKKPYV